MACKLDGQDVTVRYRLGGIQDCAPTWGSFLPLSALITGTLTDLLVDFKLTEATVTRQTRGVKGTREKTRVIAGSDNLVVTVQAPLATGPLFRGLRGYYIEFEITYVETLAVDTYAGVITNREANIGDATFTEVVTVACDAE